MNCAALIVSAGRGHRFGGTLPKQYRTIAGEPVLRRTVTAFAAHPDVDAVRVVIHPDDRSLYDEAVSGLDLLPPVHGGADRQESVHLGLDSLKELAPEKILIHDSVRPLVLAQLISGVLKAIGPGRGALPALPVADTLKRADDHVVAGTVDRTGLWRAQTPQGFCFADILAAHEEAAKRSEALTDDAAVAEQAGLTVQLVPGDERNLKITTEDDLARVEAFMEGGMGLVRVGTGFDVHRFGPGDAVTLCGVRIPHNAGLVGHSDADAGLHAITDALLGAAGAGDIGDHFPPSDEKWRDAPSDIFLRHAADLIASRGGRVLNVDLTLICERPKIAPHRAQMRERVAEILNLAADQVSVKATTTEKLGFTGREEGIAAQATAAIMLPTR